MIERVQSELFRWYLSSFICYSFEPDHQVEVLPTRTSRSIALHKVALHCTLNISVHISCRYNESPVLYSM